MGLLAAWAACTTDLDCSLNGACDAASGACACDAPWSGAACETMELRPVSFPQGYGMRAHALQNGANTSWGGNVLFDGTQYHLFVNAIANECLLGTWGRNSRIDHAVSGRVEGPYSYRDTAVGVWASNPAPIVLPPGGAAGAYKYAIFHIGNGTVLPGVQNCTGGLPLPGADAAPAAPLLLDSSGISVSMSLDGPWTLLQGNTLPPCNNPAPWVHPNSTLYALCDDQVYRAEQLTGPWAKVGRAISHTSGPPTWHYEDPFLYTTKRGFHVLYHALDRDENPPLGLQCRNSTVSAHAFSEDGFEWRVSTTQPYSTQVEVVVAGDGAGHQRTVVTVATRERPKLFFNATTGQPSHLINGVCGAPSCTDSPKTGCMDCKYKHHDYTLVQPLDI